MGPSAIRYAGLEERLTEIGLSVSDRGNVVAPEPEALALHDERARYLPEILDACAALAALVEESVREGCTPARARRRSRDRDGNPRRPRRRRGAAGRRDLDRRARRPQHARDEPVRQRARDAARGRPRPVGGMVRPRRAYVARARPVARRPRRHPLARPGGACLPARGRHSRLHDERHRPDRDRARDARGARPRRRPGLRPRLPRPGLTRPGGRAGRRHAGSRGPDLPRGAPRLRADRGVRASSARSRSSSRTRSSIARTRPRAPPSSSSRARSARRSSSG